MLEENIELPDEEESALNGGNELDIDSLDDIDPVEKKPNDENDEGSQEDEEDYGKKVQKRINKVVAERNIARDESNKLRSRVEQLEAKFDQRDIERQDNQTSSKLADIKKRKMEFMDEGEFEKAEDLNDELLDLKIQQQRVKDPVQIEQKAPQTQNNQIPEAQQSWIEGNDWYEANAKSPKAQYANALYQEILSEGYDTNDADTYSELDKRLGNNASKTGRAKPPGLTPPDRGGATGNPKSVAITQQDINNMRNYGLDPNDTVQRSAWLKNKKG